MGAYRGMVYSVVQSIGKNWRWTVETAAGKSGICFSRQEAVRNAQTAIDAMRRDRPTRIPNDAENSILRVAELLKQQAHAMRLAENTTNATMRSLYGAKANELQCEIDRLWRVN